MRIPTYLVFGAALILCGCNDRADMRSSRTPGAITAASARPAASRPSPSTRPTSRPVVAKWSMRPLPKDQVNLLAMGDWGSGDKEQKTVAKALARYVDETGVQFNGLLSLGDNFYVTLKDEEDYQFQSLFEDMFDARRINFPFYAAFGNHDYDKNKAKIEMAYAARHPDSRWKIPARWYRVDLPPEAPLVTVLMLDSNKPHMSADDWLRQMDWMAEQLAQVQSLPGTSKRWTVACAHHPLFSNGAHGDNGVLQVHWGPIFKKYKLDFYVCGHDHDLQQLEMPGWPTSFVIAGGGGKRPTKMRRDLRGPFSKSINGFSHLLFTPDRATVQFVSGGSGGAASQPTIVHQIQRTPDGRVTVLLKGGNDKASTRPLRVLLGLDGDEKKEDKKDEKKDEKKDAAPDEELDP